MYGLDLQFWQLLSIIFLLIVSSYRNDLIFLYINSRNRKPIYFYHLCFAMSTGYILNCYPRSEFLSGQSSKMPQFSGSLSVFQWCNYIRLFFTEPQLLSFHIIYKFCTIFAFYLIFPFNLLLLISVVRSLCD